MFCSGWLRRKSAGPNRRNAVATKYVGVGACQIHAQRRPLHPLPPSATPYSMDPPLPSPPLKLRQKNCAPPLRWALSAALVLLLTASAALGSGVALLQRTAPSSASRAAFVLDNATSEVRLSLTGLEFSYPSFLPLDLCACTVTLGASPALPVGFGGSGRDGCARLTSSAPRLDAQLAMRPSRVRAGALLAGVGDATVACAVRVMGLELGEKEVKIDLSGAAQPGRRRGLSVAGFSAASAPAAFEEAKGGSIDSFAPAQLALFGATSGNTGAWECSG